MSESVLALPFDQYQRYRLVADLLRELRGGGPRLRVLDVGGRTGVLREFLDDARIELVDLEPSGSAGLVLGDGARLPFKDASVDAVCAFDTLEHVPPALRPAFVAECRRVARRWVVLAGPYADPRVAEAEELLKRFLEDKLGVEHRYLEEHRFHGLPDREATQTQLKQAGARIVAIGHGNLERWLVLQCLSMYLDYDPALRGVAADFQRWYNAALYASDHAAPCYRHVVVAALGEAPLPDPARLLAPPTAPSGALAPFTRLVPALLEFDRERARWSEERGEFERSVSDLSADLAGHREVVRTALADQRRLEAELARVCGEFERERAAFRAALDEIGRDLEGHRAALALAQTELVNLRTEGQGRSKLLLELANLRRVLDERALEHQRLAAEWRAALADRESDLAAHRAALAEREHDLEGHRSALGALNTDLEAHRSALGALNTDLEGHKEALADARADLEGHRRALVETRAEAQAQRATIAALEADLAGHRATLRNLERDLEGERAARGAVEEALARSDTELRRTLQVASGLELSLAKRELVYDELRRELRSRWRNLLRVFRPPK